MSISEIGKVVESTAIPIDTPGGEGLSGLEKLNGKDTTNTLSAEGVGKEYDPASDAAKIDTINSGLEDTKHPVSDVPFTRDTVELPDGKLVEGVFPEFDPITETQLEPNGGGDYKGTRAEHETEANKDLKDQIANNSDLRDKFSQEQLEQIENGDTPDGHTWHPHQEPGKMQLVDQKTHNATAHTGGYILWG